MTIYTAGRIYCSPATAALVQLRLKVKPSTAVSIIALETEKKVRVCESVSDCACNYAMLRCVQHKIMVGGCFVDVMLCDANHCPGAVCILFTFENGRRIFHTGDFRWSRSLLQSSPTYRALVSFSAV